MRSGRRVAAGLAVLVGALVVTAAPASAHVTVSADEAVAGERAQIVFRVPNESDSAATTQLEVHFPEDTPIASVSTAVVPGWTADIQRTPLAQPLEGSHGEQITEAVSVVTWVADDEDSAIQPGEFGLFPVSVGPLPEVEVLFFRTLQTYSDGEVARWIDIPAEGVEPEFPAPSLQLTAAGAGSEDPSDPGAAPEEHAAGDDADGAPVWLAVAGLVAGLAGLALGGVAFLRTRERTS